MSTVSRVKTLTWALRCSSKAFNSSSKACSDPSLGSLLFKNLTKEGNILDPLHSHNSYRQLKSNLHSNINSIFLLQDRMKKDICESN